MTHLEQLKQDHPGLEYFQGEIYEKNSLTPIETDGDKLIRQHYAFVEFDTLTEEDISVHEFIIGRFEDYKTAFNNI